MTTEAALLAVEALHAGYGRVPVLHGVSLEVRRGEVVTILGANGAGKSTLLRTITGFVRASRGRVVHEGEDITGLAPERAVRRGIALVPEGRMLFGPLTVAENLALGAFSRRAAADVDADLERVLALFPVLRERLRQTAATLSGGEQQMLAVARALMSRPSLLLLDEPSLGLAPKVIAEIFAALDSLRAEGLTVLLVEQDVKVALKHADRGYVMRAGRVVHEGGSSDLLADEKVRHIYLGVWDGRDGEPAAAETPRFRTADTVHGSGTGDAR